MVNMNKRIVMIQHQPKSVKDFHEIADNSVMRELVHD